MARPQAWRSQTAGPLTGRALHSNVPRGWRKIPLGIDEETRAVRAVEITGSHIGDAPVLPDLLNQRLSLDVVKLARKKNFDVAVIFSQDQDLCEVVDEIKEIAKEQDRYIHICCPFPSSSTATSRRGIDGTNWFRMDQKFYDACLDPRDYRPQQHK